MLLTARLGSSPKVTATRTRLGTRRRRSARTGRSTALLSPSSCSCHFMYTAERNAQGRIGSAMPVRLSARTTGAVQDRIRYDIPAPLLDSTGCVRSDSLFLVLLPPCDLCAVHMHALRLLYIYCTIRVRCVRLTSVCSYATLWYTHICARLAYWVISFPTCTYCCCIVIHRVRLACLFGICRRDSLIAGVVVR